MINKNAICFTLVILVIACIWCFPACNDPEPVNPEELITNLEITFIPDGSGDAKVFRFIDPDGDGGNTPQITADTLSPNTWYSVQLEVLNTSLSPPDTITQEIKAEAEAHQFFYQVSAGLHISFTYADADADGKPIGVSMRAQTGAPSTGQLIVTLRHEPDKNAPGVANGDITNAGGDTDIEVVFSVVIQN
ncbi:MAG: hypothetical protein KatS3mg031_2726 [Chitinophagales bacterium]|nr:MAG: hypothetical protein KatS3mg031_2726 [Chitinophagales bacterium]